MEIFFVRFIRPRPLSTCPANGAADDTVGVAFWTTVEVGIGITAGCIATLRPLLQLVFSKAGIQSSRCKTPSCGLRPGLRDTVMLPLDFLKPGQGVITTITGRRDDVENQIWQSRGSSHERLTSEGETITRQVVIEYKGDEDKVVHLSAITEK